MCDQQSLRSAQSDQSLCLSLEYSMIVKLLTEHHLEYLSLKGGCRGSSVSTLVKMPHCWKSHALAQIFTHTSPGLICVNALPSSQPFFSHVRMFSCLPWLNQCFCLIFDLILYVPSTIFQLCRHGSS